MKKFKTPAPLWLTILFFAISFLIGGYLVLGRLA